MSKHRYGMQFSYDKKKIVRETFDIVSPCPPEIDAHATYIRTCNAIFVAPWQNWVSHAIVYFLFPSLFFSFPSFSSSFPFFSLFFPSFLNNFVHLIFRGQLPPPCPPCSAAPVCAPKVATIDMLENISLKLMTKTNRNWSYNTLLGL